MVGVLIVVVGVVKVVGGVMADMVIVVLLRVGIEVVGFNLDIKLFFLVNLFGCI
jgi:hypothetical protein